MQCLRINWLILLSISILGAILLSTTAFAETDININNNNIIRFGRDVRVAQNKVVENAHAIGGDVTIEQGARVTKTTIAIDGDVILQKNARVDIVRVFELRRPKSEEAKENTYT